MKTLTDFASLIALLSFAIVLPILAGAELERHGYVIDLAAPAIIA